MCIGFSGQGSSGRRFLAFGSQRNSIYLVYLAHQDIPSFKMIHSLFVVNRTGWVHCLRNPPVIASVTSQSLADCLTRWVGDCTCSSSDWGVTLTVTLAHDSQTQVTDSESESFNSPFTHTHSHTAQVNHIRKWLTLRQWLVTVADCSVN